MADTSHLPHEDQRFRTLLDVMEDGVILFEISPVEGPYPIRDVNEAACRMLGYTRQELLNLTIQELDDAERGRQQLDRLERGDCPPAALFETRHLAKNGRSIPVEINARNFELDGSLMVLSTVRDITARKAREKNRAQAAQSKLDVSEANTRGLIDASPQSMLLVEPDGTILQCNKTVADVLKRDRKSLVGTNIYDNLPPDVAAHRKKQTSKALATRAPIRFTDVREGNFYSHSVHPILESGEVARLAIYSEDVSNLLQKDKELERTRHLQSLLFEIMRLAHASDDLDELLSAIHDIMLREVNARNFSVALIDEHHDRLEFIYCHDRIATTCANVENISSPATKQLHLLPIRRNQLVVLDREGLLGLQQQRMVDLAQPVPETWLGAPLQVHGVPFGVLTIQDHDQPKEYSDQELQLIRACTDQIALVVERKRAEDRIRESEEHYRAFFQENQSVMLILDPATARIVDCNQAAASFYGYKREALISTAMWDISTRSEEEMYDVMGIIARSESSQFKARHTIASGEIRDVEIFSGPFEAGGQMRIVAIVHDITQRLKDEKELSRAKEAAEQASMAKDEFIANISHEVRTPLNGVMGMLQLLRSTELDEEQQSYAATAQDSSRNLLRVLNDVLDFSKVGSGKLELMDAPFDLERLVTQCSDLFRLQLQEKNISLVSTVEEADQGWYRGDEGRIRQVLFNLLGNSIKFTENGHIHLESYTLPHPKSGKVRLFFSISDTGVGIPEDKIDHIFETFTQVDSSLTREHPGTGLGLSIVKRLVHLMGGSIAVISKPGEGTTMLFFVLVAPAREPALPNQDAQPTPALNRPLSLLLAEDEKVNRIMAKQLLEKMGHQVTTAKNGEICLDMLLHMPFDGVLMDIQLPVVNGLQATDTIRTDPAYAHVRDIPIIALTAHAGEADKEASRKAGMDAYVSKPFESDTLLEAINEAITSREPNV